MIIVFTGNGKGKTTAALGTALRSIGNGKKVKMIQFIKGPFKSGEDSSWQKLSSNFELIKGGIGFVGILNDPHSFSDHKKAADNTWELCKKTIKSRKYNLVIMDEINAAMDLKLIDDQEIKEFLQQSSENIDIICTGRNAPKWLIDIADLVTEMKDVKHPFNAGKQAKRGIEF